ncbi:hypothetical protein GALMADRAFT_219752 [Galerina marginata CBS 339.88]|uniref:Transmembrane protein n=1 Tax=Galerina marginata (strain CBS 339.88) TaxID=685588 RepID=A0A067TY08_GALM3|nr:hypothetical protein GALMADRAFT_219752 [Galerina marginata CBS 339.88]
MDATARRSSSRVHTVLALTALALVSFIALGFLSVENPSIVLHDRRHVHLVVRQEGPTPAVSSTGTSASPTTSSVLRPPPGSSNSTGLSVSPSPSINSGGTSSTTSSFSSVSSSVVVTPTSSSISRSSSRSTQSAQTSSPPPTIISQPRPNTTPTETHSSESADRSPATTFALTNNFAPTLAQTSYIQTASSVTTNFTPISAAANSSGFWQKKGAVAATFVIVALVVIAITAILIVTFLKKRSTRMQDRLHDELFEKYSEPDHRGPSPGPSINAAPMDPFASREVRYDTTPAFESYVVPPTQRILHSSSPVQHPDYYNQPTSQYLAPSQFQAARSAAPPTAFRNLDVPSRDSYQPSIDSFYGAAGQPSGYSS